jgi:hypothetical protein
MLTQQQAEMDCQQAQDRLHAANLGLVIVRDGQIQWESSAPGVGGLLQAIEQGRDLRGAALADRVVGRAVALLACHMGLVRIYGEIMSDAAVSVLGARSVPVVYSLRVTQIHNRAGTGLCPLERLTLDIEGPGDAVVALRQFTTAARASL